MNAEMAMCVPYMLIIELMAEYRSYLAVLTMDYCCLAYRSQINR